MSSEPLAGVHLLVECGGVDPSRLRDGELLSALLREAAQRAGARIVDGPRLHVFPGGGITGFVMLAESHVSLHTYPEHGYCALDAFTCGAADPEAVLAAIRDRLAPSRLESRTIARRIPRALPHGSQGPGPVRAHVELVPMQTPEQQSVPKKQPA